MWSSSGRLLIRLHAALALVAVVGVLLSVAPGVFRAAVRLRCVQCHFSPRFFHCGEAYTLTAVLEGHPHRVFHHELPWEVCTQHSTLQRSFLLTPGLSSYETRKGQQAILVRTMRFQTRTCMDPWLGTQGLAAREHLHDHQAVALDDRLVGRGRLTD